MKGVDSDGEDPRGSEGGFRLGGVSDICNYLAKDVGRRKDDMYVPYLYLRVRIDGMSRSS